MARAATELYSPQGPLVALDEAVKGGMLEANASQRLAAEHLQRLYSHFKSAPSDGSKDTKSKRPQKSSSLSNWLFRSEPAEQSSGTAHVGLKGAYFIGGVGVGKTMLMDMLVLALDPDIVWREHFHRFMYEVHDRMVVERKKAMSNDHDPLLAVADQIANQHRIICLDEFFVNNVADAMILQRLFSALFEKGVVLVTTSNVEPDDLYKDGLQRDRFLPFIDTLKQYVDVIQLSAERDYRQTVLHLNHLYLSPLGRGTEAELHDMFRVLNKGEDGTPASILVRGRDLDVPMQAENAAFFRFDDLCNNPLGPEDYNAIAQRYTTVFVGDIPELSDDRLTEVKRFISLIDVLYDTGTLLVASAAAEPDQLYTGIQAPEFERTASRLTEMQSQNYLDRVAPGLRLLID